MIGPLSDVERAHEKFLLIGTRMGQIVCSPASRWWRCSR